MWWVVRFKVRLRQYQEIPPHKIHDGHLDFTATSVKQRLYNFYAHFTILFDDDSVFFTNFTKPHTLQCISKKRFAIMDD
jgi:hypothetical protein